MQSKDILNIMPLKRHSQKIKKPLLEWNDNADFVFTYYRPLDDLFVYTYVWSGTGGREQTVLKMGSILSSYNIRRRHVNHSDTLERSM